MTVWKKIPIALFLIIVALLSATKISPIAADENTHTHSIEQINREIGSVLKLTAGATAASAGISLLPDDQCTPIAEEFAELGKYFIVVLSALYLEKYLITIVGFVAFSVIIPLACVLLIIGLFAGNSKLDVLAAKIFVTGIVLYVIIPLSVKTSETIYQNYESNIEDTISTANEISVLDEDQGAIDKFISWVENAAGTIVDYVTGLLSRFVEAVAVMVVTACLIPILVIIFFAWLLKVFFKLDISMDKVGAYLPMKKELKDTEG